MARLVRSSGRFALFDIVAEPNAPLLYPAPWADMPDTSFLTPPDEIRALVAAAGFRELSWVQAAELVQRIQQRPLPMPTVPAEITTNVLMGALGPERIQNAARNTREGRTLHVMGVFEHV